MKAIINSWPFQKWDLDIVGLLPITLSQKNLFIMATNYFSKWIEVESLATIQESDVQKFIWRNIICSFGLPYKLVTDNGQKFTTQDLSSFCHELNIKLSHSTLYWPQANGQAESSNKTDKYL